MNQTESDDFCTDLRWRGRVVGELADCYIKRTMSYDEIQTKLNEVIASLSAKLGDIATLENWEETTAAAGEGARASVTEDGAPIYYNRRKASDPVQYSPPPAQSPGAVA